LKIEVKKENQQKLGTCKLSSGPSVDLPDLLSIELAWCSSRFEAFDWSANAYHKWVSDIKGTSTL